MLGDAQIAQLIYLRLDIFITHDIAANIHHICDRPIRTIAIHVQYMIYIFHVYVSYEFNKCLVCVGMKDMIRA